MGDNTNDNGNTENIVNPLNYILFKENSQSTETIYIVLNFLNGQGIYHLNPMGMIETNYPDEVIGNLPAIYLTEKKRYILGERGILIFLAYHSELDCNYITLKQMSINHFTIKTPSSTN